MKTRTYLIIAITIIFAIYMIISKYIFNSEVTKPPKKIIKHASTVLQNVHDYSESTKSPFYKLKMMLHKDAPTLSNSVINKVLTTLECANEYNVSHNQNIVTIIDYSLPSNQKRLWVVDLKENKVLFNTYVSHGIKSGFLVSNSFSNKHNSKASSIGVYKTEKAYYGHEGLSLHLEGLERNFNDQAYSRSIVMHGGWYMDDNFIKKYGRAGRSWGCTALPLSLSSSIINIIKDQSFFIVYYPNEQWLLKSRFLHCKNSIKDNSQTQSVSLVDSESEPRDDVLFADFHSHNAEDKPILIINADDYKRIFQINPPLTRMLRRQINNVEYIALNNKEFQHIALAEKNSSLVNELDKIYFSVPTLKMSRGYYITEMKIVPLGQIKNVTWEKNANNYTVYFADKKLRITSTNRFIRWLGL